MGWRNDDSGEEEDADATHRGAESRMILFSAGV